MALQMDATKDASSRQTYEAKSETNHAYRNSEAAVTAREQRSAMRQLTRRSRRDIREHDVWFAIDLRWVESWIRFTSFHMTDAQIADYADTENCHPRPSSIDNSKLQDPKDARALRKGIKENE